MQEAALKLLASAANYDPESHTRVLSAFDFVKATRRLPHRLSALMATCETTTGGASGSASDRLSTVASVRASTPPRVYACSLSL